MGIIMKAKHLTLILTALVIFVVFRYLLPLVLPFALAYLFAKFLSPAVQWVTKKLHWKKKVSVILLVSVTLAALAGFVFYITSTLIGQTILLLQRFPVYQQMFAQGIESLCRDCDQMLSMPAGTSYGYMEAQTARICEGLSATLLPGLSAYVVDLVKISAGAAAGMFIFVISVFLILFDDTLSAAKGRLRPFVRRLRVAGFAYIKSQAVIIFLTAVVISAGLFLIGNDYAVLFGVGIAVFDAFPVVGSGVILLPWAVLKAIGGDFTATAILVTVFLAATILREIMEPRLFAKDIGLKPLYVLIAVYVGMELFSVLGLILGPAALMILKAVNDELDEETA